jgi:hypothetical protein
VPAGRIGQAWQIKAKAPTTRMSTRATPRDPIRRQEPQDKSSDKDKTAAKDEPKPMVVPPEAKQKQDLAFLKGDWRSRTGLATATGERDIRPATRWTTKARARSRSSEERHHLRGAGRGRAGTAPSW